MVNLEIKSIKMSKQYLSGPNIWTEFEFKDDDGNRHWYHLFGEQHTLQKKELCYTNHIDFKDFLEDLFKQAHRNKIYTDFFLEIPYQLNVKTIDDNNYLSQLYLKFQNCFAPNKKCTYNPYVKMHTTDIRTTYKFNEKKDRFTTVLQLIKGYTLKLLNMLVQLKFDIYNLELQNKIFKTGSFIQLLADLYLPRSFEVFKILLNETNYKSEIEKIIEPILAESSLDIYLENDFDKLNETLNQLYSLHKVRNKKKIFVLKHQLDELRRDKIMFKGINMSDWIYHFLLEMNKKYQEDQLIIFKNAWSKIYLRILESDLTKKKDLNVIISLFQEFQQQLTSPLTFMDSTLLDGYIMARMFRRYGESAKGNSVLTVVYEGLYHVEIQSIFFKQILGLKPLNVERGSKEHPRCLKIDLEKAFDILQYGENVKLV